MNFHTVKIFDNTIDAHIVKSILESEDISCYLLDEHVVTLNPLYYIAVGGIKLQVTETDFQKATQMVNNFDTAPLVSENGEIIECPNCNSREIHYGFKSMKGRRGIFSAILSFLFMVYPLYFNRVNRCKSCDTEFKT